MSETQFFPLHSKLLIWNVIFLFDIIFLEFWDHEEPVPGLGQAQDEPGTAWDQKNVLRDRRTQRPNIEEKNMIQFFLPEM